MSLENTGSVMGGRKNMWRKAEDKGCGERRASEKKGSDALPGGDEIWAKTKATVAFP